MINNVGDDMEQERTDVTEQALFERYEKTRSEALRNHILEKYLYIAEIVAKKFVGRGVEYDDLFQVASLALVKALDRFEVGARRKIRQFCDPHAGGRDQELFP